MLYLYIFSIVPSLMETYIVSISELFQIVMK
jgi:hypothetical protein